MNKTIKLLQEFSIPLISGIIAALFWANTAPESYHQLIEKELFKGVSFHFMVNDIFMVFFFAIAAIEIVQSLMPGGDLNPVKTAVNPLLATAGGVLGPIVVYLGLNLIIGSPELFRGWGIPTATDIAIAWLVAKVVFGEFHPGVKFLLLIAIADDAIGLAIIAIFYPNPLHPVEPAWLLLVLAGMAAAYLLRRIRVSSYWPYLLTGGIISWTGLHNAQIHPALALVFIVPFLPHPAGEKAHLFEEIPYSDSVLEKFERDWRIIIDFGLFFFGLANAGVQFSNIGTVTWLVFIGLLVGKTIGICLLSTIAAWLGFPLPEGMALKELFLAAFIAASGLTVALFVAGTAFIQPEIQAAAKMGALFSGGIAPFAIIFGRLLGIKRIDHEKNKEDC